MITYTPKSTTQPTLTFWGAARTVSGSMHLLEDGPLRILMDCGKERTPTRRDNSPVEFPFEPGSLTAVVISHAHIDHCGRLPHLVRQGFEGSIYCTPATRDLLGVVLMDSARIQEEDARVERLTRSGFDASRSPHLTRDLVEQTLAQCVPLPYNLPCTVSDEAQLHLFDAGHVLGSAIARLTISRPRRTSRITFTGDLGRRGLPYLHEFDPAPESDFVISEATYGGRFHQTMDEMEARMASLLERTVNRGGKLLIPSFSLGRTQLIVHYLQRWMREGRLLSVPLYVDSPLAALISRVYDQHTDSLYAPPHPDDPVVRYIDSREESRAISRDEEPCVIVASGGMCDGGRILDHLRLHIDDMRSTLALISYQAPDSLGAQLMEKTPTVRFHGQKWNKWIEVVQVNGFSGHADHNDLLTFFEPLVERDSKVCLVHCEVPQAETLVKGLQGKGFHHIHIPDRGESVGVV